MCDRGLITSDRGLDMSSSGYSNTGDVHPRSSTGVAMNLRNSWWLGRAVRDVEILPLKASAQMNMSHVEEKDHEGRNVEEHVLRGTLE